VRQDDTELVVQAVKEQSEIGDLVHLTGSLAATL
jgi:hypothetical protein